MDEIAAPLLRPTALRVVNEDAAHRTSRHREEVGPVVPGDFAETKSQIGLMYQRCRIERMAASLTCELMMGDGLELSVNEGEKVVGSFLLASRNLPEQSRDGVVSHIARSFQPHAARP
jgi:hypothetical protein